LNAEYQLFTIVDLMPYFYGLQLLSLILYFYT